MELKEAYLLMFYVLVDYYSKHEEAESLGSIISDMDPTIFQDREPADPATYTDWKEAVCPFVKNEKIEKKDLSSALEKFLIYYQNEFGYELENIIAYVNKGMESIFEVSTDPAEL